MFVICFSTNRFQRDLTLKVYGDIFISLLAEKETKSQKPCLGLGKQVLNCLMNQLSTSYQECILGFELLFI